MTAADTRDRYQPETRLEAGLGGERWFATDRQTGASAWLAVLDARAANEAHRAQFEAWTRVGPSLSHPSLERVLGSGETSLGNPYFAVEEVQGETLAQRLDREPALSVHELVRVVTAVVDGLLVAHRAGLVHGDLAPERIYLLAGGRARVTAFGLNRAVARTHDAAREASTLPYSDAYMSPEQAAGGAASALSDLWSVAAMLYRGVTGIPPRAQMDGRSTCAGIVHGPTRAVLELRPDLPNSFVQLLGKALDDDPAKRFKDAAELRKALTSALILAPAVARLPVIASPLPPEVGEGIETSAPALPPPPTRARTGIGPLGYVGKSAAELPKSTLGALAPGASSPAFEPEAEAPPLLTPRMSDPPSVVDTDEATAEAGEFLEDFEEVEPASSMSAPPSPPSPRAPIQDEDEDGVLTSAMAHSVRPPAPLAQRGHPTAHRPDSAKRSDSPPAPPSTATVREVPPAPAPQSDANGATNPASSPGLLWPSDAPSTATSPAENPPERTRFEYTITAPSSSGLGLPRKAWAAIGVLALGIAVSVSGGVRLITSGRGTARTPADHAASGDSASDPRRPTQVGALATTADVNSPSAEVDAGSQAIDAGVVNPIGVDAGPPIDEVPAVVVPEPPPVAIPTPTIRSSGTTHRTQSSTAMTVAAMTTATSTPMATPVTPRVDPPPAMTTPMATPMADTTMNSLARDPGF